MATNYDINIRAKDQTGQTFNSIERKMERINKTAMGSRGFPAIALGLNGIGTAALATGAAVGTLASRFVNASVSLQQMENRLRLTTNSTAELTNQMGRLRDIARDNRTGFEDTVQLYTNLKIATEELGFSTQTVEELTTKMSQALAVAGADAATTSGVIRQFGQAMASGTVRGDEFNSIVEGLGPALSVMARESGISVGKLREMAFAGELTAEKFSELLLNSNSLSEAFEGMEETLPQTIQKLNDNIDQLLVNFEKKFGIVKELSTAIEDLNYAMTGPSVSETTYGDIIDSITKKEGELAKLTKEFEQFGSIVQFQAQYADDQGLWKYLFPDGQRAAEVGKQISRLNDELDVLRQRAKEIEDAGLDGEIGELVENIDKMLTEMEKADAAVLKFGQDLASLFKDTSVSEALTNEAEMLKAYGDAIKFADEAIKSGLTSKSTYTQEIEKQKAAVDATTNAMMLLSEGFNRARMQDMENIELIKMRDLYTQRYNALLEQQKVNLDLLAAAQNAFAQSVIQSNTSLLTAEQQHNMAIAEKQKLYDSIKAELKENTGLTDENRAALERMSTVLYEQLEHMRNSGPAYQMISELTKDVTAALDQNTQQREVLLNVQQKLINQSNSETNAGEALEAQLYAVNEALKANAEARRAITGQPLTFAEELQATQDRIAAMKTEDAMNAKVLEALKAEGVQREYLERLGLVAPLKRTAAKKEELSATEKIVKALAEENKKYQELNATIANDEAIKALEKKYGVAGDEIKKALEKARDAIKKTNNDVVTLADIMKDKFKTLSEGLAGSLTDALMNGKEGFENFKDYLRNWAKSIMSTIIEKLLIQPMIDQMTNWMGLTNKSVGGVLGGIVSGPGAGTPGPGLGNLLGGIFGGGGGLFGGLGGMLSGLWGGISSFGSSLWSGISGFFGNIFGGLFANGGYLPSGKIGIAGEAGPELISGPARILSNEDSFGGKEPVVVNFNINAIDTQTGTEFIMKNKKQITGVIQDAYNRRGKQGVY